MQHQRLVLSMAIASKLNIEDGAWHSFGPRNNVLAARQTSKYLAAVKILNSEWPHVRGLVLDDD